MYRVGVASVSGYARLGLPIGTRVRQQAPHSKGRGGGTYLQLGGQDNITRCRRQCIEARSGDQSARSAEKFFRLHFSAIRMGSRGTFVLLHCKFQMYEDCRSRGRHVLLSCSNFAHERNTYVHGYRYTRSFFFFFAKIMSESLQMANNKWPKIGTGK